MMKINQFEIWIADLRTEPGKTRPVVIIQTNLLNNVSHPSTIICPLTTKVQKKSEILRVHIPKGISKVKEDCDIMIDQMRAIDNKRLVKKIGELPENFKVRILENIKIILDIDLL